jgi:hypothetical protein
MPIERLPPKPGAWTITKRQVVAGHLTRALQLFILEDDPLSAHLLCGAARDIIHAVLKNEGKERLWDQLETIVKEEKRGEFFALVKEEYNFLKHADPNREAVMTHYTPEITAMFLWETCVNCNLLFGTKFIETMAFEVWFLSWHPGIAKVEYAKTLDGLKLLAPQFYDVQGRMTFDALRQSYELFSTGDRGALVGVPYLADYRASAPMGVEGP